MVDALLIYAEEPCSGKLLSICMGQFLI